MEDKITALQKVNSGAKKSSQTIGLGMAVIVVWGLKEFGGVDIPTVVEQAITAIMVVLAARFGDD